MPTIKALKSELKTRGVNSFLTAPDANPKIAKNMKDGVITWGLHLAPADLSGFNVCASSTAGCREACLHTAGNPLYMVAKEKARIARTKLYFQDRELFLQGLQREIDAAFRKAKRVNMAPAFRLNATSDIPWERVALGGETVIDYISTNGGECYDYTKRANRKSTDGYHLTFSLAESNLGDAVAAHRRGLNVAVVYDTPKGKPLPSTWSLGPIKGIPVHDGDLSDYRPADPTPCIVGLRAKGLAKGDQSGFVQAAGEAV